MSDVRTSVPDVLVTTYLHMSDPCQFRPAYLDDCSRLQVIKMDTPDVEFYRFLYATVGKPWHWRDRLSLCDHLVEALLTAPGTSVYILYVDGVPAGYIELAKATHSTEIVYFGLRPSYLGRGLGKHLLSCGIASAWEDGTQRLWVHTCNLDNSHALDNYIKRGFSVYKVREQPMPQKYR